MFISRLSSISGQALADMPRMFRQPVSEPAATDAAAGDCRQSNFARTSLVESTICSAAASAVSWP